AVDKQHAAGKLTVRERIDRLFDAGTFTEIGVHATHAGIAPELEGKVTPADGVVTGFGKIEGRLASVIAYDFTVMAGSMGRNAETKCNRAREIAYTTRIPMIWLIDSAGARIQEAIGSRWFAGAGLLFREESIMSGVVPPVAAMVGPGAADRRDEALLTILPDSPRRAYDVRKVLRLVVDHGRLFEIKPGWAKNIVTALARLNGHPVGVIANQPMVLGGALDIDSADKAARFIMLCDAFGI